MLLGPRNPLAKLSSFHIIPRVPSASEISVVTHALGELLIGHLVGMTIIFTMHTQASVGQMNLMVLKDKLGGKACIGSTMVSSKQTLVLRSLEGQGRTFQKE